MSSIQLDTAEDGAVAQVFLGEITGDDNVVDPDDDSLSATTQSTSAKRCSTALPSPSAPVWTTISNTVTDGREPAGLRMDPGVLAERKLRFRQNTIIWLTALLEEVANIQLFDGLYDPMGAMTSWSVALFLTKTSFMPIVEFICSVTLEETQYIFGDPDSNPRDLLLLPKVSKTDNDWGVYANILTRVEEVMAWYVGSGTGFGLNAMPSGLIGRVLSYFMTKAISILHDGYLRGAKGKGMQPNSRKLAGLGIGDHQG